LKRGWHSGIYIGDNHFVHAPNQNSQVRKEELTTFWVSRLKRVIQVIEG
jgi:cell wall-associated NlpC family hydrolase